MKSPNLADAVVMCFFPIRDMRISTQVGFFSPTAV